MAGVGFAWKTLLEAAGVSVNEQDMVGLFRNTDDPLLFSLLLILAIVIAPITEELLFRAGLFRYLRTRIPRSLALLAPAFLFAILHGNLVTLAPLLALGMVFSLAYERTGSVVVPIVAHALFNLNTVLLIMAGFE